MAEKAEVEQTHCVISKVFAFTVPPLESAEGFKASVWPKQPIWVGRLRVVSRGGKCAILLEHTDRDGLFASCPLQSERSVEPTVDSSRYFVLRLSDGKGRSALLGLGFNDRAQAFDFKVALQDWDNQNREPEAAAVSSGPAKDYSIPQGGSISVSLGGGASSAASAGKEKKKRPSVTGGDVSAAMAGMKLGGGEEKEKKKKNKEKKKDKEREPGAFEPSAAAASVVGSSSSATIDFGFAAFDPLASPGTQQAAKAAAGSSSSSSGSSIDPFAPGAAPSFGMGGSNATPFDTPFDDTPADWVKF